MISLLRKAVIVVLVAAVGGSVVPRGANTARAQDSDPVENPYSDRSPEQVYTEEAEGHLRVGLGEADITPTWPVQLPYGADSKTSESYGKTKVKALLLEVSGKKFVILGYDLIGIGQQCEVVCEPMGRCFDTRPALTGSLAERPMQLLLR